MDETQKPSEDTKVTPTQQGASDQNSTPVVPDAPTAAVSDSSSSTAPSPTPKPEVKSEPSTSSTVNQTSQQSNSTPDSHNEHPTQKPEVAHKSHALLFIVIGVTVLLIGAMIAVIAGNSGSKTQQTSTAPTQSVEATPTIEAKVTLEPSGDVEEVESVNVTEDNTDLKDVEKDIKSL